ncbi:MAG: 4-alpha-glucanotransferase [Eubacterium sp.]|nr:4-alpha-glucanotransferase [Eubacterium sp.]
MNIYHNSREKQYRTPFGAVRTGEEITLSVDVTGSDAGEAFLQLKEGDEGTYANIRMTEMPAEFCGDAAQEAPAEEVTHRYSVKITAPDTPCLLGYRFRIVLRQDEKVSPVYYCNNQEALGGEGQTISTSGELIPYQITVYRRSEAPEWYKNGIVYQIFPDRFARDDGWKGRCEEANKVVNDRRADIRRVIEEDWDKPAKYVRDDSGRVVEWSFYGGSFKGIKSRLGYLRSLGVTAIYLNPIFEATSNHRYDTADYMRVDPALGTEQDFTDLAKEAKEQGIRLILDGVFSHTGADSVYFDRFGNYPSGSVEKIPGAYGNLDSPYRSWYKFDDSEKCGYRSWWGVDNLPEVNEEDPGYRSYILGSTASDSEGVVPHWLKLGASGWRLDVADELPDSFIKSIRTAVKNTDPDALLIGEVWEDASNKISYGERRQYFAGDELDGTMNYPFRSILLDYINYSISSGKAGDRLMSLAENYPGENFYSALNLIGSHDRERIMTMMAGEQDRRSAGSKVRMLSALQYALPGVPCIYYGDEAGMTGGADPENRSCYPWGHEDEGLRFHYRMLGLIYDEHPVLKSGSFEMLSGSEGLTVNDPDSPATADDVLAFVRKNEAERILVLVNRSYGPAEVRFDGFDGLKCGYAIDLLTSEELPVEDGMLNKVHMDSLSVRLICMLDEPPEKEELGRNAGVICHLTSLGEQPLGKKARNFVDFLADAGFGVWQVLPLNPPGLGDSPYDSASAFAGDTRLINRNEIPDDEDFDEFCSDNAWWLRGYVAYTLIRKMQGGKPWYDWPDEFRLADPEAAFAYVYSEDREEADRLMHDQYLFYEQWTYLKEYANSRGIRIMGDIPMYMAADSADVWANRNEFLLDENGRLKVHAGVPPDYFSKDGQDWGNPLYDWVRMKENGYDWWMKRLRQCAERFDILRIDHFRGLSEYYAIPEGEKPAKGMWQHSAGLDFIRAAKKMLADERTGMKLLAEDLGFLDAGVYDLLKLTGLPGMDIWQFTAGQMMAMEPDVAANRAFYTGTHDNQTLYGFVMEHAEEIIGHPVGQEDEKDEVEAAAREIISKIYESPTPLAMVQLQDVFMLDDSARMNVPGVAEGNWSWRIPGDSVCDAFPDAEDRAAWFRDLAKKTDRL